MKILKNGTYKTRTQDKTINKSSYKIRYNKLFDFKFNKTKYNECIEELKNMNFYHFSKDSTYLYVVLLNTTLGWIIKWGITSRNIEERFKELIFYTYDINFSESFIYSPIIPLFIVKLGNNHHFELLIQQKCNNYVTKIIGYNEKNIHREQSYELYKCYKIIENLLNVEETHIFDIYKSKLYLLNEYNDIIYIGK